MNRRPGFVLLAVLGALVVAGCGEEDPGPEAAADTEVVTQTVLTPAPDLSPAGMRVIQRARGAVAAHCRQVAAALEEGGTPPQDSFEKATAELDELARLATEQPEAEAEDGTTPRLALGDIAENLEGTNCDQRLVARIDEALATVPAG